jgi:Ca-activated chloride channel family protein
MIRVRTRPVLCSLAAVLVAAGCHRGRPREPLGETWPVAPTAQPPGARAPFHFSPQPHPPRQHPLPPPPPALETLPRLIDAAATCFGPARPAVAMASPPGYRSAPSPAKSAGSGRGGPSSGTGRTASVPPPASAPPSVPPASAPPSGGAQPGYAPPAGAMPAPPAPPYPASAEVMAQSAPTEANRSRGSRRKDRRAERQRAEAEERTSAPAAPMEAAAESEMAADDDVATDAPVVAAGDPYGDEGGYHDWGQALYLSNDDTMSLSSAQRVLFAIDHFLPLPAEHVRPHELLNYFSFDVAPVPPTDDFSVLAGFDPVPGTPNLFSLALAVRGRPVDLASRRNVQLSMVVDRSGSMADEGRMEYLRRGLLQMTDQLKTGDILHLTVFDHRVCVPLQNFVVGRDDMALLRNTIQRLRPEGSTDLHAGLTRGYELADRAYQPTYSNRVIMITDALANTGETDEDLIATIGKYYDARKIRLSGVGVGTQFNDALLDRLTERGRGAYVFLGSEAEVDAVFGSRFVSLVETTAEDVHFRLHLPPSLRMNVFYGEESSVYKEDVQSIHYFANTSQLFLQDVMARGGPELFQDQIMLTIDYQDPETGQQQVEEYAWTLGDLANGRRNVAKGRLLMRFIDGLAWMARRSPDSGYGSPRVGAPGSYDDPEAFAECERGHEDLSVMAAGIDDDPEVGRVRGLWERYCSRFERPRNPVRRAAPPDAWPGAAR